MRTLLSLFLAAVFVGGCATAPGPFGKAPSRPPAVSTAPRPPEVAPVLAHEQRWLDQWFKGTPVQIGADDDGALRVEVPLEFSFDAGKAAVKPPLAAVLDKVSESLRRQATARVQVGAPADNGGAMGRERAASVRGYLVTKGVQARRITRAGASEGDAVELRLLPAPGPIERLEDEPPAAGRRSGVMPTPAR